MRHSAWLLTSIAAVLLGTAASSQEKGGVDLTGPYDVVANWMKPIEEGYTTGVLGVFAESADRIYVTANGATPGKLVGTINLKAPGTKLDHLLFVLNRDGKVVEEWKNWYPQWGNPHYVRMNPYDPEKHVWFLDRDSHQIFQFTHDGKQLVKTIGEHNVAGVDDKHFGRPADIAWLPDGTAFVADGYQNRRVVKLDKNGKFIKTWGQQGKGPGEFGGMVHGIAVDAKHRVYVTDGGNHRIQIFDENGKYLDEWPNLPSPMRILVQKDQSVWVIDVWLQRLLKFSPEGKLLTYWGSPGDFPGASPGGFTNPHDFSVDPDGNLYIAMAYGHRIEKYVPRPGANKSRLILEPWK